MTTALTPVPAERPSAPQRVIAGPAARQQDLTLAYRLSGALAVVALVGSLAGALIPNLFRDPAMSAGNARGTDLVILTIALPTLTASMRLTARGSLRAQLAWLGSLAYILYNAVPFAFAMAFNRLFLVYVATLSLALWSLVALLVQIDAERLRACFAPRTPVRTIAVYLLVMAGLFCLVWLKDIIPAMIQDTTPASLRGTRMLTNWVQVLDLGFTLPLCTLAGVRLWQRRPWGYLLSGLLLITLTIETASIATDQVFGHLSDPRASLAMAPVFALLTLVGLALTAIFLRDLQAERAS